MVHAPVATRKMLASFYSLSTSKTREALRLPIGSVDKLMNTDLRLKKMIELTTGPQVLGARKKFRLESSSQFEDQADWGKFNSRGVMTMLVKDAVEAHMYGRMDERLDVVELLKSISRRPAASERSFGRDY